MTSKAMLPGPPRRNQFLLGPTYLQVDSWRHYDLGEHLKLSAHKDLNVHQSKDEDCQLTLIGYVLDWSRPEASDAAILKNLASETSSIDTCVRATNELGGRWILVYQDDETSAIFHDAGGLRQICYALDTEHNRLWCASQVELLSQAAGLTPDAAALSFIETMAERNSAYWWPGDRLPFTSAKALLPNHRLNLLDGECQRYWPYSERESLSESEACRRACNKLSGVMRAASNRSQLALGLTAGWDSRVLLAAARDIADSMTFYTERSAQMATDHNDVVIPRKLARRFGLNHVEILAPDHATNDFVKQFNAHSWRPHPKFAAGAQADFEQFRQSYVAVVGNFSEVARLPYRNQQPKEPLDGRVLAQLIGMGGEEFAISALEEWLSAGRDLDGYKVLDLFYWEQRVGRWLAGSFIEYDFAWKDLFVPFNIRSLLCDLLACDEQYRSLAAPHLYLEMMESLWPEVLQEPINPRRTPGTWKRFRRRLRRRLQ